MMNTGQALDTTISPTGFSLDFYILAITSRFTGAATVTAVIGMKFSCVNGSFVKQRVEHPRQQPGKASFF